MVPLVLSVAFGLGIWLLYEGLTNPRPPAEERPSARRVREFLIRAGLREVTVREFVLFSLGAGLASGLVAQLVLGWALVSILAFAIGLTGPFAYYVQRHDRRRAAVQAGLVEAIVQLRDAIRSGLALPEAIDGLAAHGPEALRSEFVLLSRETRLRGLGPALLAMRERLADPVLDTVAASLLLNHALGGRSVSQILDTLARATQAQLRVERELRAYQAKNVLTARIVAAVPLGVLLVIRALNPDYLAIFDTFFGQLVLAGCVLSVAVGYAAMLWLSRLPGEPRVLT